MPLGNFGNTPAANMTHEELLEDHARFKKEVTYLLNGGIDTLNVNELNAEVINAGILNAGLVTVRAEYEGGAFIEISANGIRINDGTKDTFTADTAGQVTMTGGTVQSSASAFPRVEMTSTSQLFTAYRIATDFIRFHASLTGSPTIEFDNGTSRAVVSAVTDTVILNTLIGNLQLWAQSGNLTLTSSGNTNINGKIKLNNGTTLDTLSQSNSGAATLPELVADFNSLLSKLRSMNILA